MDADSIVRSAHLIKYKILMDTIYFPTKALYYNIILKERRHEKVTR